MKEKTDVLIVGAGIAGISASIYLKRGNADFLLLDKGAPGGKLNNIHRIDNYAGLPSISGPQFAMDLLSQMQQLGIECEYGNVLQIQKEGSRFLVKTDMGDVFASSLLLCPGLGARKKRIPGEKEFLGRGVSYCATCDGAFFKGKDVAVEGSEDHAVEDVLYLSNLARKVYFLAPKEINAPESHLQALKKSENVVVMPSSRLIGIQGEKFVDKALIATEDGEKELSVSGVFPLSGESPSEALYASLGLENEKGFLVVDPELRTSVPGVFAAGDIVKKTLRQLITAASEGAIAATSILAYLRQLKGKDLGI